MRQRKLGTLCGKLLGILISTAEDARVAHVAQAETHETVGMTVLAVLVEAAMHFGGNLLVGGIVVPGAALRVVAAENGKLVAVRAQDVVDVV